MDRNLDKLSHKRKDFHYALIKYYDKRKVNVLFAKVSEKLFYVECDERYGLTLGSNK